MHCFSSIATQISWENCDSNSNSIKLLNLTVNPYPIIMPGSVSIEISVHSNQDLTSPIKGDHMLTIPITIFISSWTLAGNYQGQVHIQTNSGATACVKVSNVHIKLSK
ncbi:unnamed protein product [Rotaria sordida]|uniref:Uncharacterized protein n=1 Tax=Rotaria sordida TaxID=392033 RepID=A0A818TJ62_9BILA|nr:unnamed protein product [Rotaria sordida]CAF3841341.1 unnamed protein product [Rotaria sordida]